MREKCPICNSEDKIIIKSIQLTVPEYFHLPNKYDIVTCNACGFCYASTKATLEDYEYYYSHCNSYSGTPTQSKEKLKFNNRIVEYITNLANQDSTFLDIGFGKGHLMRLLRKKGFSNVYGIDPALESIIQMQEEGFIVYKGSIFDDVRTDLKGKFDFVFLFDVLEHLLYPNVAIENASGYLNRNGYLIIGVPNYAVLFDDHSILVNQFNQEHINYFSAISLDNLLKSKGFFRVNNLNSENLVSESEKGLLAVFRFDKMERNYGCRRILKDEICKKSIETYIQRNNELEQVVNNKLIYFGKDNACVYVWGTGAYAMWLLSNTKMKDMNIQAFIDNNSSKIGKKLIGKPIISAEQACENIPIIICSMRFSHEIVQQIKESHMLNTYLVI